MAKLPKKLGDLIDLAYDARDERIGFQREMDAKIADMKAREKLIADAIFSNFDKNQIEGAKGGHASASVTTSVIPQIDLETGGWPVLWEWAKKNDALDLFEKRLAKVAVRERLEAGQKIPAVKTFVSQELSLRKINGK